MTSNDVRSIALKCNELGYDKYRILSVKYNGCDVVHFYDEWQENAHTGLPCYYLYKDTRLTEAEYDETLEIISMQKEVEHG